MPTVVSDFIDGSLCLLFNQGSNTIFSAYMLKKVDIFCFPSRLVTKYIRVPGKELVANDVDRR